ncbi:MAG: DUF262 and DUF1524 domain-containing protein [Methanobrevibacter sp.]|nr:DUF262 and DUF1524 domain-containing protein [Methanobrevibacter sp.]
MNADDKPLSKFLNNTQQLRIPIYQRRYSWNLKECQLLFEDILRIGKDFNKESSHFIGSIVYIEDPTFRGDVDELLIIDGQQRLTTLTLILIAVSEYLKENPNHPSADKLDKIISYYLVNDKEKGNDFYKLLLNQEDKDSLLKLIDNLTKNPVDFDKNDSIRIKDNYEFFKRNINERNLSEVYTGILKLEIVEISLERGRDNPQLIFESLNSTGLELNQADLIRNYILMGLELEEQEKIYNNYWRKMELGFAHSESYNLFDRFIRDYLTIKLERIPTFKNIYTEFKVYSKRFKESSKKIKRFSMDIEDVEELMEDIFKYAKYYFNITYDEEDEDINNSFKNLNELGFDVTRPFLLEVYKDYAEKKISKEELIKIINLVESYLLRRNICNIPTPSLNKTFATLYKSIDRDNYLESLKAEFIFKDSYKRFPHNEEFKNSFLSKDIYNLSTRNYILGKLENKDFKEKSIDVESYTIEHIMPQNPNLSQKWREELGENWEEVQKKYLHNIGNLTLTAYNSELSDKSFSEKITMVGGFKDSRLHLNKNIEDFEIWNENAIKNRAKKLFTDAKNIWSYPDLSEDIKNKYIKKDEKQSKIIYTIEDHKYLKKEQPMRNIFDKLSKRVLNIDATVVEEPKKLYVAFKSINNFVDVIPQKNSLILSLNIPFKQIEDPDNKCRDVTGMRKWGNGNVEFKITSDNDIEYAMFLIKQSFKNLVGEK